MKDFKLLIIIGIIIIVLIIAAAAIERLKTERTAATASSGVPYNLVTTFKGDARSSRAFTWYTGDPGADGWLEIVKGSPSSFAEGAVIRTKAVHSVVKTDSGKKGVHKAEITGLEPGTMYSYRAGSGTDGEWSGTFQFSTAEKDSGSVTFINVTDSQGASAADFKLWGRTLDKAFQIFPEAQFIVHNGDFTEEPGESGLWNKFFSNAQGIVGSIPLMPVTGNHDEIDGQTEEFTSHFNLPDNGAKGSVPGTAYSFDYGPVHVAVLNTESHLKAQTKWLKEDLAGTDKPWKIVAMHRPAYGGSTYKKIEDWTAVFDKYGVDLVLQGHNHEYSRSYPLLGGKIVSGQKSAAGAAKGTVYVVTNASGGKFNEKKTEQFYHKVHFQNEKQMFAGISVRGNQLTYQAYDVDGSKLDEFVLKH
ncbi:metallophosphoesterase [Paenibacillus sp. PK3_47]|uniref:purple acid phosphatase family protein n=1 Tax=Paenibacillus sp. PK3_47 TaxID=2072642 RepID=UPI00201DA1AC|nr:metallophosphoesterase family protein [Paenibacillus sp. PK3_47]UQZ36244.1 metallophosphoesterase [Paenibacillus sp. PK3_47]